jgi:hypothetical protein
MSAVDLELPLPKPKPSHAAADAIAKNPDKSDRAIAAELGIDHKTVGKARKEYSPLGNSPPTQNSPPGASVENSPPENSPPQKRNGVTPRNADPVTGDGAMILCPGQAEVSAGFNDAGDLILTQTNLLDDDATIVISAGNVWSFIDKLTDCVGVPSSMP